MGDELTEDRKPYHFVGLRPRPFNVTWEDWVKKPTAHVMDYRHGPDLWLTELEYQQIVEHMSGGAIDLIPTEKEQ